MKLTNHRIGFATSSSSIHFVVTPEFDPVVDDLIKKQGGSDWAGAGVDLMTWLGHYIGCEDDSPSFDDILRGIEKVPDKIVKKLAASALYLMCRLNGQDDGEHYEIMQTLRDVLMRGEYLEGLEERH